MVEKDCLIILGSKSPRRSNLLREVGIEFVCDPSGIDEELIRCKTPRELAVKAAYLKAMEVSSRHSCGIVIAADTIVCIDDRIIGKPKSKSEARRMLKTLRNRKHTVISGLAVKEVHGGCLLDAVETDVFIKDLSDEEIEEYINTDEPYDKAGAYAIQGDASRFVDRIEGCYHNVVGLPLLRLRKMLGSFTDVSSLSISCGCELGKSC